MPPVRADARRWRACWAVTVLAVLTVFLAGPARADVWGFMDAQGVAHFAAERIDERYELFFRGTQSLAGRDSEAHASDTPRAVAVPTAPTKLLAYFDVSPSYKRVKHHLRTAARDQGVDYELLQAMIATESGFDAQVVSPRGAVGLMQIMPLTAQRYGVQSDKALTLQQKLQDAGVNIHTGTRYLRDLLRMFSGQLELALAAYNAGEGAVRRAGNQVPNFKETQDYVKTVMQLYALLKPPRAMSRPDLAPPPVRLLLQGGASQRGNMVGPVALTDDSFH